MKPTMLRNGLWVLAVAGAYGLGMWNPLGKHREAAAPVTKSSTVARAGGAMPAGGGVVAGDTKLREWVGKFETKGVIAGDRMKEAVEAVLANPDPVEATLYFTRLLNELTPENASFALEALLNSNSDQSRRFISLLAHAWGAMDGPGALKAMQAMEATRGRGGSDGRNAKSSALAAWADHDPEAAFKWAQESSFSDRRDAEVMWRGLLSGIARRDVDLALSYLKRLPEESQPDLINALVDQKLREGPAATAEWAMKLPAEDMRTNALETVGETWLRQDLDGAVKWAGSIANLPDAHEAVADIADEYSNRNPQAASAWASSLPAGDSQDHAFEDIYENWTHKDPEAASKNLTTLPAGAGKDFAIQAYAKIQKRNNPLDAITWAGQIGDAGLRTELQVEIARDWRDKQPDQAQAWISANLPPELQASTISNHH